MLYIATKKLLTSNITYGIITHALRIYKEKTISKYSKTYDYQRIQAITLTIKTHTLFLHYKEVTHIKIAITYDYQRINHIPNIKHNTIK